MGMSPAISVILPTFNRIKYLSRSISSVQNQDYENWELVIVDDGSSDGSENLVREKFGKYDPRITFIKIKNSGQALARNHGFKFTKGKYIFFLDSDDAFLPMHFSTRVRMFQKYPKVDFFYGGKKVIGDQFCLDIHNPQKKINIYDCVITGTFSMKREVFEKLGGFENINYGEDYDFMQRAAKVFNVQKIEKPVTYLHYRDHEGNVSKNYTIQQLN